MDIYKDIKGVDEKKQHTKFKYLKNEPQLIHEKNLLSNWAKGLVDRDKKFVREFQETFHSSFWEIYLYQLFKRSGFELDQTKQMPDFIIKKPLEFYVEAVVANIKENGRKENDRTLDDQISMAIPPYLQHDFYNHLNDSIIRASNSINSKYKKYKNNYIKRDWVNPNNPFIVAIGSYDQVNYGREYIYPMLALLYGMYFDPNTENYLKKDKIIKEETHAEIPLGIFLNNEYEDISAIIYSCTLTLGKLTSLSISQGNPSLNSVYNLRRNCDTKTYQLQIVNKDCPEDFADGIFIFHNPNAKNKLPDDFLKNIAATQFYFENNELLYKGNIKPIISRINTSIILKPLFEPILFNCLRKYNRLK